MGKITDVSSCVSKVREDYYKESVELNSAYLEFPVKMSGTDLIMAYATLQADLNGDHVALVREYDCYKFADGSVMGVFVAEPKEIVRVLDQTGFSKEYDGLFSDFLQVMDMNPSFDANGVRYFIGRFDTLEECNDIIQIEPTPTIMKGTQMCFLF